jgi:hypothetical protein
MPRRFRPRLSYANVASTLALVLALGGVSYAAVKINGKTLKDRTVGAVKIKKNSLTGKEVNEAKLAKVPLAALADLATNATHATNADNATNAGNAATVGGQAPSAFKLSCPQGLTLAIGQCFETSLRTADTWSGANKTCGSVGRRLPTIAELESARQNNVTVGVPPNNYEMSGSINYDAAETVWSTDPAGNRVRDPLATTRPFRCIQNQTN